ncbi:MAG: hypothetical protein AAFZ65_00125 [Planctomycetota bacterium]
MTIQRSTAFLSLAGIGLLAGFIAPNLSSQATIDGRRREAIVFFRGDTRGIASQNGAAALAQSAGSALEGELIRIASDHILLEVGSDQVWIPREVVHAVRYDE